MIDAKGKVFKIEREKDDLKVKITPIFFKRQGLPVHGGSYILTEDATTGSKKPRKLGQININPEDSAEWNYIGSEFDRDEQKRIAYFIKNGKVDDNRPTPDQLDNLKRSMYHTYKMMFDKDLTDSQSLHYDGEPISPRGKIADLKEVFDRLYNTFAVM